MKAILKEIFSRVIITLLAFLLLSGNITAIDQAEFPAQMSEFIAEERIVPLKFFPESSELELTADSELKILPDNTETDSLTVSTDDFRILHNEEAEASDSFYTVQILATSTRENASELKNKLSSAGFADLQIVDSQDYYRLLVGEFTERDQAEELAGELSEAGYEGWVTDYNQGGQLELWQQQDKVLAAGSLKLQGEFTLEGYRFRGEMKISPDNNGLTGFQEKPLESLVERELSELQSQSSQPLSSSALKALAVISRSRITAETLYGESDYLAGDNFPLSDVSSPVQEAVAATESNFLVKENKIYPLVYDSENISDNPVISKEEYGIIDINDISLAGLQEENYQQILEKNFSEIDIVDMKERVSSRKVVDARVQRGLNYREIRQQTWWGSRVINLLELDLNNRHYSVFPVLAGDTVNGREDLREMGVRNQALGGINGGFFAGTGRPLGLLMIDGKLATEKVRDLKRTTLLISDEGEFTIGRYDWEAKLKPPAGGEVSIQGANRAPEENEAVLINSHQGDKAPPLSPDGIELYLDQQEIVRGIKRGDNEATAVPEEGVLIQLRGNKAAELANIRVGDNLQLVERFTPEPDFNGEVKHALAAGPNLVSEGEVDITAAEEQFQPDIVEGRAPRSALGLTADDKLLLVTVDGRQPERSIGMELEQLAELMIDFNVVQAMNLDGGDTARLLVRGFNINVPSGERNISNSLLIKSEF